LDGFETSLNRFDVFGVSANQIRWSGMPAGGLKLRRSDALAIPFSLMWGGFALFWEVTSFNSGAPLFFRLWGIPFVLIGLYMIIGRFFWDAYIRANTWYGLTDDSALFLRRGLGGGIASVSLPSVNNLSLQLQPDGSGTIYFGDVPSFQQEMGRPGRSYGSAVPAFRYIPHASAVYEKCQAAQRRSAAAS